VNRPVVVVTGPDRSAISGVSTHVNLLLDSPLAEEYELVHFRAGSQGLDESALGRWLRLLASPFTLFATIVFRHASVVHINTSMVPKAYWRDVLYLLVAKLLRARVIWQVHGGKLPQRFFPEGSIRSAWLRWTLSLPDLVVLLARVEDAAYRRFVPSQDIAVLPNAIDYGPFQRVPTVRSRDEYPLRLVFVGRLDREKGLYETLQGLRLAHELGVDARLTVAGEGPEEGRLKRYAQALGIASRVSFVGGVFGAEKVDLFAQAEVFVLPSYSEGLPYALLEAMAAGIPVVATPVGAIPDVISHGTHGYLVPARDGKSIAEAIAALGNHRDQLTWMSRACRRRIRAAYGIDRLAAEFSLRYAELCDGVSMPAATPGATIPHRAQAPRPPAAASVSTPKD
jgi:glycosyltransferase involved in cell wall biosynthesis